MVTISCMQSEDGQRERPHKRPSWGMLWREEAEQGGGVWRVSGEIKCLKDPVGWKLFLLEFYGELKNSAGKLFSSTIDKSFFSAIRTPWGVKFPSSR